jgi:hypothetical protein
MSRVRCEKRGKVTRVLLIPFFDANWPFSHATQALSGYAGLGSGPNQIRSDNFHAPFFSMELWPLVCFYSEFTRARQCKVCYSWFTDCWLLAVGCYCYCYCCHCSI